MDKNAKIPDKNKEPPPAVKKPVGNQAIRHMIAGGLTGGTAVSITYPTEFIKTAMQLSEMDKSKLYKGPWDCFSKIVSQHGFLRLYRGFPVVLYGSIPKFAVRFCIFELLRESMEDSNGRLTNFGKLFCGLGAGVGEAVLAVTPMETVKVKFINDSFRAKPEYKSFFHGIKLILQKDGLAAIYKAPIPTLLKQGSSQGIRFLVMENLRDIYRGNDRNKPIPKPIVGLMGAFAGATSVFCNNPIDVLKTRMQSLSGSQYKSTLDCAMKIFKAEGLMGFYVGTIPRLCRVCLDVGCTFMIYDMYTELLNKYWT